MALAMLGGTAMRTLTFFCALFVPNVVLACSLAEGHLPGQFPLADSDVGPAPLFVASGTPTLLDSDQQEVELVLVEDSPYDQAQSGWYGPRPTYTPAEDLSPGGYVFYGDEGEIPFTVVAEILPRPAPLTRMELTLRIHREEEESQGCGVVAMSCGGGDSTTLGVTLPEDEEDGETSYLVTVISEEREQSFLVRPAGYGESTFDFHDWDFDGMDVTNEELCVTVSRVGNDGALGESFDGGCIDGSDRGDLRVQRTGDHDEGCAAAGGASVWGLLALLLTRRRTRR